MRHGDDSLLDGMLGGLLKEGIHASHERFASFEAVAFDCSKLHMEVVIKGFRFQQKLIKLFLLFI